MQPFYATNGNPARAAAGVPYPSTAPTNVVASDLGSAVRNSALVQQLAPATDNRTIRRLPSTATITTPEHAKLVAYLQEEAPEPEDLDINAEGQRAHRRLPRRMKTQRIQPARAKVEAGKAAWPRPNGLDGNQKTTHSNSCGLKPCCSSRAIHSVTSGSITC